MTCSNETIDHSTEKDGMEIPISLLDSSYPCSSSPSSSSAVLSMLDALKAEMLSRLFTISNGAGNALTAYETMNGSPSLPPSPSSPLALTSSIAFALNGTEPEVPESSGVNTTVSSPVIT